MTTEALLEESLVDGPKGKTVDGLSLTCNDCDNCAECTGYDTPENRLKLVSQLRNTCPEKRCTRFKIVVGS